MLRILKMRTSEKTYFKIAGWFLSIPFYLFRIFPINRKKIVFSNFGGKGFGDNPKYIALEILRQNLNYELVWLLDDITNHNLPKEIRAVDAKSFQSIFEHVTAALWIDNSRKAFFTKKRRGQYHIHTWHAGIMLKRVEKDAEEKLSIHYVLNAVNDSRMIDLVLSNSDFYNNFYKTSFWYGGKILECGFPKTDILLKNSLTDITNIKLQLGLLDDLKIALYAPTFRNSQSLEVYIQEYQSIVESLNRKFHEEWVILLRLHPSMAEMGALLTHSNNVINVSTYDDMQELMLISDLLITDYSSSMFEYMLLRRPIFLYASDLDEYIEERGFYFSYESLPFPTAATIYSLKDNISNFDQLQYLSALENFITKMGITEDGTASAQTVNVIKHLLNN